MEKIILPIIILFILWLINNTILRTALKKYQELNDYTTPLLKNRKTIMFDIILLIFFIVFDINFLLWIGIIYFIIISIVLGLLLIISLITGIDSDLKNRTVDKDVWTMFFSNCLNVISSIIMIFTLLSLLT